ncbi:MAG: hypothetical protein KatS3mg095_0268 [Candidatus Parcubacteria bacterium]|nr:MAG: hypothetical protein KatS3mg095_0268 [Candidatus Parcubacteria bacterium]
MKIKGQILIYILIYNAIAIIILSGLLTWIYVYYSTVNKEIERKKTIAIAEAGIEYYRWRLNHFPQDYTDGTGQPGPYIHNFEDRLGNIIGQFILEINPPLIGSTIVKIISKGKLNYSNIEKIIESKLGIPSLVKFSVLSDDNIRFGEGTVVYGQIHSNKGIRFDGIAYNLITSALETYDDPDHTGPYEWAVHTHRNYPDPLPPNSWNNRPDVFKAGRQVGVPTIDFIGISANLAEIKDVAISSGFYKEFSGNNNFGYEIILKDNGTFDLYVVNSVKNFRSFSNNCCAYDPYEFGNNSCYTTSSRYLHNTWSISNKTFLGNYQIPESGVIFIEDNLWLSGKINNKRLIIASAKFPDNSNERTRIIINNNLSYTNYDGKDSIGLISQKSITIGLESQNDLRIDAALIAQNGRVGRFHYSNCGQHSIRNNLTIFGSIASRIRYGFAWVSGNNIVSGYSIRNLIYDGNLLYSPPPRFPLASEFYEVLNWQEIK